MARFGRRAGRDRDGVWISDVDDVSIDLTDGAGAKVIDLVAAERTRDLRTGRVQWGLPAPCPDCGAAGYLDHIDLVGRFMLQHCPDCGAEWAIAEADIEAAKHLL